MRKSRSFLARLVVTVLLATAVSLVATSAKAQDTTRLVREGEVLAMSFTEMTVQEDGTGKQTYSLGPTGLWSLNAQGIVTGDRIRYTVYGSSGYAQDFQKLSK
jgi:hypothetical protein